MIQVLEVTGGAVRAGGAELARRPPEGMLRWIDVCGQTPEELAPLAEELGLHPLAIEDCLSVGERPKLEEYDSGLFVVIHEFECPAKADISAIEMREIHCFLLERCLVTVHLEKTPALAAVWKRAAGDASWFARGADFLLHAVCDAVVDDNFPLLDRLSDALDDVEDQVLSRLSHQDLTRIFRLKKTLITMRRTLSPQRDVFALLARRGDARVSTAASAYFRDVYDHLTRIYESIDTGRDMLGNALDAYLSSVANRTNEIMKRLTILSSIFLPLAFVVGFFGMNFVQMPFHAEWAWVFMLASMGIVPVGMLLWFKKMGWFD